MKNKIIKLAVVAAASVALTQAVQADQITGSISMNGTATLDSQSLSTATMATGVSGVTESGATAQGSFAGVGLNDPVTWVAFAFSGGSASPLWSFTDGTTGYTYTFALTSDYIVSQTSTFLNIAGLGTLNITGVGSPYVATPGAWTFTISDANGQPSPNFNFTFANSNTSVPDGGTTAMLLGAGLSGLALLKRKLVA